MGTFRSGNSRSRGFNRNTRTNGGRFGSSPRGFRGDKRSDDRFGRERRGFGGGDREMHDAECSKCGKQCKIPFRPSGGKPVYCTDCFKNNNSDTRGSFAQSSNGISQEQFSQLNTKLDKILTVLKQLEVEVVNEDEMDEEPEDERDSEDKK